jgi:hypothetical protein
LRQTLTQAFVGDITEGPPAAPRLGFEPRRYVLLDCQSCPHIMMLFAGID